MNIPGNAQVDRALEIAKDTNLSVRIIGNVNHIPEEIAKQIAYPVAPACPCGNLNDKDAPCYCTTEQVNLYRQTWTPVDISIEMSKPRFEDLKLGLNEVASQLLKQAYIKIPLTVRQLESVLRVAARIQSMENAKEVQVQHIAEAIQYQTYKG